MMAMAQRLKVGLFIAATVALRDDVVNVGRGCGAAFLGTQDAQRMRTQVHESSLTPSVVIAPAGC